MRAGRSGARPATRRRRRRLIPPSRRRLARRRGGISGAGFGAQGRMPPMSVTASTPAVATDRAAILTLNNVEVVYDHVILVLKGVSMKVPQGAIVALLGANGAGK